MGNRAAVIFTDKSAKQISPAIYLHWNGGPESVYAFLDELRRRHGGPGSPSYAAARFAHIVCDFFDSEEAGSMSIGMETPPAEVSPDGLASLANSADDNGVYVVSPGDGKEWCVRRFVLTGSYDKPPREMTKREVAQERKLAYQHHYNSGKGGETITNQFVKMRPNISKYG
jgi:hypothetical protein